MSKSWSSYEKDALIMESWRHHLTGEPKPIQEIFGLGQKKKGGCPEGCCPCKDEVEWEEIGRDTFMEPIRTFQQINQKLGLNLDDGAIMSEFQQFLKDQHYNVEGLQEAEQRGEHGAIEHARKPKLGDLASIAQKYPNLGKLFQAALKSDYKKSLLISFRDMGFEDATAWAQAPEEAPRPETAEDPDKDGIPNDKDPDDDGDNIPDDKDPDDDGDGTPDEEEEPEEAAAEATYINRPVWKEFGNQLKTIVVDDKKTQQLLNQVMAQFKANNIEIGQAPQAPVTEAATAGQVEGQFAQMKDHIENIIVDPANYYRGHKPTVLAKFWTMQTATPKTRFQGWRSEHLKALRELIKQAAIKSKEFMEDETQKPQHRKKAQDTLPMMTKFGKVIDNTRKGQTATTQRQQKAMADKPGVQGKNVVPVPGKFMISGMAMYMGRNLGMNKGQVKKVGAALQQFVSQNTNLTLGENWIRESIMYSVHQLIKEEYRKVIAGK
jgi:hypothetical protein